MTYAKHWASSIRFGERPVHGLDVRVERICLPKRLSSTLSSHLSQRHPMGHPNGWRRGHAPPRGLGSSPSSGSDVPTLTPVVVVAGSGASGVVSLISWSASSGGSP